MTDQTEDIAPDSIEREPWDPDTDRDGFTLADIKPKDWFLDTVLNFAHGISDEQPDGHVGLTVQAGGAVVSGLAISRAAWIIGMADLYSGSGAAETGKYIKQVFDQAHEGVVEHAKERNEANLPNRARGFLHMKDARIMLGAADEYVQVPLWRGALADITGWSLGSWNPPTQNPGGAFPVGVASDGC